MLNGIVDIANRIELGQVRAGLVVSCETAREINDMMIERPARATASMERVQDLAGHADRRLRGGGRAGDRRLVRARAAAPAARRRDPGGPAAPRPVPLGPDDRRRPWATPSASSVLHAARQFMSTDSVAVLKYGVELGLRTWKAFLTPARLGGRQVDKVICHQVGAGHRDAILKALGIAPEKDFSHLRVPGQHRHRVAAADRRPGRGARVPPPGDRVGFLGIGSGLNCLMLGVEW